MRWVGRWMKGGGWVGAPTIARLWPARNRPCERQKHSVLARALGKRRFGAGKIPAGSGPLGKEIFLVLHLASGVHSPHGGFHERASACVPEGSGLPPPTAPVLGRPDRGAVR